MHHMYSIHLFPCQDILQDLPSDALAGQIKGGDAIEFIDLELAKKRVFFFDKKWHLARQGSLAWGYVKNVEDYTKYPANGGLTII